MSSVRSPPVSRTARDTGPGTGGRLRCDDGAVTTHTRARPGALITAVAAGWVLLAVAALVAAALLDARVPAAHRTATGLEPGWIAGLCGITLVLPGALLLRRMPRHPVAWILVVTGVHWALDGTASYWLAYATTSTPARPGAEIAVWIYQRLGATLLLSLPLVLLFYPDGRLPRGRWRIAAVAALASTALLPAVLLVVPADVAQAESGGGPLPAAFAGLNLDLTTIDWSDSVWNVLLGVARGRATRSAWRWAALTGTAALALLAAAGCSAPPGKTDGPIDIGFVNLRQDIKLRRMVVRSESPRAVLLFLGLLFVFLCREDREYTRAARPFPAARF